MAPTVMHSAAHAAFLLSILTSYQSTVAEVFVGKELVADQADSGAGISALTTDLNGDGVLEQVVGAPFYDLATKPNAGMLRVVSFLSVSGAVSTIAEYPGNTGGEEVGFSLAKLSADLDGDGINDIAVGVPRANQGRGEVRILSAVSLYNLAASPGLNPVICTLKASGVGQVDEFVGWSLAALSNGNLAVGAPGFKSGTKKNGRVLVFAGCNPVPIKTLTVSVSGDSDVQFGHALANLGDINSDGTAELAVGSPYEDVLNKDEGSVRVYSGSNFNALGSQIANFSLLSYSQFGYAVSAAGDTDLDGKPEVLIGAPRANSGGVQAGEAYVYRLQGSSWSLLKKYESAFDHGNFGRSVAAVGDLSALPIGDVAHIIGQPDFGGGGFNSGAVYAFGGSQSAGYGLAFMDAGWEKQRLGERVQAHGDASMSGALDFTAAAPAELSPVFMPTLRSYDVVSPVLFSGAPASTTVNSSGCNGDPSLGLPVLSNSTNVPSVIPGCTDNGLGGTPICNKLQISIQNGAPGGTALCLLGFKAEQGSGYDLAAGCELTVAPLPGYSFSTVLDGVGSGSLALNGLNFDSSLSGLTFYVQCMLVSLGDYAAGAPALPTYQMPVAAAVKIDVN